jgi:hypothetical protein
MGEGTQDVESAAREAVDGGADMRRVVTIGALRLRGRFVICGCKGPFGAGPRRKGSRGAGVIMSVEEQEDGGDR